MIFKTRLSLAIFLVQLFLSANSEQNKLLSYIKTNTDELEDIAIFQILAKQFTPNCLWVVVGGDSKLNGKWDEPVVILDNKGNQSEAAAYFLNQYTEKMTKYSCVTYFLTHIPKSNLLGELMNPEQKVITRFFMGRFQTQGEAESFLLDKDFQNEEHIAAIVLASDITDKFWNIFTRQLLSPPGEPLFIFANRWSLDKGFNNTRNLFPEQMGNFYGKRLRGVTLDFKPFTHYSTYNDSRVVQPEPCLDVSILNVIAKQLNFTYELVMPEDGLWGTLDEEGHWNGVVGEVEFNRADFSLVLTVSSERRPSVDFTRVYFIDPLSFVTAKNRPRPPWLKLITPFSDHVWILVVVSVFAAMILYYVFFVTQSAMSSDNTSPSKAFMNVWAAFLGQSLPILPSLTAGQILIGFWFLYALLVTNYYKTSLTASFAVPRRPPTIDTLQQLLDSDLDYGMIDAKGSEYQMFSTSDVPLYQKLFKRMAFYSSDESMRRVAEGKYAYIYFKNNIEILVRTQFTSPTGETNLHVASEEFFPAGYGWAFPKGAPYRRTFDAIILKCMQSGLISKWVKDLYGIYLQETESLKTPEEKKADREASLSKRDDGLVVLNLNHLQGAFLALFIGFGISGVLLLIEYLIMRSTSIPVSTVKDNPEKEIVVD